MIEFIVFSFVFLKVFWDFLLLKEPNVRIVVLACLLLSAGSAAVGVFAVLRKRALVGDVVAHSILPGICIAFLATGSKHPLFLLLGALGTGWLSLIVMNYITVRSKIKEDTATALSLSVFFGLGILLLTYIQHQGNASQSGLDKFLFGKAASLLLEDVWIFGCISGVLMLVIGVLMKEFTLFSFDPLFSAVIGKPVRVLDFLLTAMTVLAVVVGIQAVGVVLMAAMLITPPAAARYWTNNVSVMVLLSAIFGMVGGYVGAFVSYLAPAMPTGPWIVVVVSLITLFSILFAPQKGVLSKWLNHKTVRNRILKENILKAMFQLLENQDTSQSLSLADITKKRSIPLLTLKRGINFLIKDDFVHKKTGFYSLTDAGFQRGKRLVKLHRLWEVYLATYLRLPTDHLHDDAETIEHILTPQIEQELEQLLNFPKADPHQKTIPY